MPEAEEQLVKIQHVLARLYAGRAFTLHEWELSPLEAFSPRAGLPLFIASAAKIFNQVHPGGLPSHVCHDCGETGPARSALCTPGCTFKSGVRMVRFAFGIELTDDPVYQFGLKPTLVESQALLTTTLLFLVEAAQRAVSMSLSPQVMNLELLIPDVERLLRQSSPEAIYIPPGLMEAIAPAAPSGAPPTEVPQHA